MGILSDEKLGMAVMSYFPRPIPASLKLAVLMRKAAFGLASEVRDVQHAKDKAEIDHWREKCFNDTMSAKKSGWDDAEKFFKAECEQKVKEIKELMKKAEKEYNALRSFASKYDYSRGKCENILMLFGVLRK